MANILDSVSFEKPRNESPHRRKSAEDQPSLSFQRHFSNLVYDEIDEDFLTLPIARNDACHVEEHKRTRIGKAPTAPRHDDAWPGNQRYFSTCPDYYPYPQHGNHDLDIRGVFQKHSYIEDDVFEDELAHPIRSHCQYGREAGLPMGRSDYISVCGGNFPDVSLPEMLMTGALHEDDIALPQNSSLYDTPEASIDHVHGRIDTLEAMMSSVAENLRAEHARGRPILDPEINQCPAELSHRVDAAPFGARRADHRHKAFRPEPQPPRSKYGQSFVNLRDISLKKSKPERAQKPVSPPSFKAQLKTYNEWWSDIQDQAKINKPNLESIPFLSSNNLLGFQTEHHGQDWKWAAYQFFCLAFDLHPRSVIQPDYSIRLAFATPPHSTHKQIDANFLALRAQLKLEKVRWHEDRLRAQFGDELARDERVKSVWGAVMELKKGVDEVLEAGWMRRED